MFPFDREVERWILKDEIRELKEERERDVALMMEFVEHAKSEHWLRKERLINILARFESRLSDVKNRDLALHARAKAKVHKHREYPR